MKTKIISLLLLIGALVLSACGGSTASAAASSGNGNGSGGQQAPVYERLSQ